jgi:predicted component of type VI protein secretion system
MTKLEDIEKAVTKLAPAELAKFRAWFDAFDAARFDERLERDAESGKLDQLADKARADFRAGRVREL